MKKKTKSNIEFKIQEVLIRQCVLREAFDEVKLIRRVIIKGLSRRNEDANE